jgi:HTH-type transcriptional regulator/antitoxin HigA
MSRASIKCNHVLEEATLHWKYVAPLLVYPKNSSEYDLLVKRLDQLLDIVGDDENHSLIGLVDALSNIISMYDENNFHLPDTKGIDALKYLMKLHKFNQSDLQEIGSQGVISEILNGKRNLNLRQIKILSKLFKVDPTTFIDDNTEK